VLGLCGLGLLRSGFSLLAFGVGAEALLLCGALVALGVYDLRQKKRSILRNYPITGHIRFTLEAFRPEIRQYFFEGDNDDAPFSRAQRSLVYQRAKAEVDKRPFGTQLDVHA
jgi:glutamate synthase domain-containing protein 2